MVAGGMMALFLALFGLVEALGVPLLGDPSGWLGRGGVVAAAVGVGLLVADVFLPVPSSLVMVTHGALFGIWAGTALSVAGSVGAAALGFALGRRGSGLLARLVTPAAKGRADALLARYGALAVVVSRPLPLVAETVAILAGASPMPWGRLLLSSAVGALPPSLLYALAGATSRAPAGAAAMSALVLAVAGLTWWLGTRGGEAAGPG
jgi:uncharacterized membrane protein YdjX (TVP38/TMEM64 family)